MNLEELKVTLEMLNVKYHYYFSRAGKDVIYIFFINLEIENLIKNLIEEYNLEWNSLSYNGKLKGIYIIY